MENILRKVNERALIASAEFLRDMLLNDEIPMSHIQVAAHKAYTQIKDCSDLDLLESRLTSYMQQYPISALYFNEVLTTINDARIETYTHQLQAMQLA